MRILKKFLKWILFENAQIEYPSKITLQCLQKMRNAKKTWNWSDILIDMINSSFTSAVQREFYLVVNIFVLLMKEIDKYFDHKEIYKHKNIFSIHKISKIYHHMICILFKAFYHYFHIINFFFNTDSKPRWIL